MIKDTEARFTVENYLKILGRVNKFYRSLILPYCRIVTFQWDKTIVDNGVLFFKGPPPSDGHRWTDVSTRVLKSSGFPLEPLDQIQWFFGV